MHDCLYSLSSPVAAGQGQAAAGKPQVVEKIVKVDNTEAMEAEKKKIKEVSQPCWC